MKKSTVGEIFSPEQVKAIKSIKARQQRKYWYIGMVVGVLGVLTQEIARKIAQQQLGTLPGAASAVSTFEPPPDFEPGSPTKQGPGWWQASDGKWYGPSAKVGSGL